MSLKDFINAVMPGVVRGGLSVGGWAYLTGWARRGEGRSIRISVTYRGGFPEWNLSVVDIEGAVLYTGKGSELESLTMGAVNALGKRAL